MGMMGYLHRVPADRLPELLADPNSILSALYPDKGEPKFPECMVERTWNAIEFILDRLAESGRIPWIAPLTGDEETGLVLDYGPIWYRTPEKVRQLAQTVSGISKEEFRQGYMPKVMAEHGVYPNIWARPEQGENFEYVWRWFTEMVNFYREAAMAGDAMLLHLG